MSKLAAFLSKFFPCHVGLGLLLSQTYVGAQVYVSDSTPSGHAHALANSATNQATEIETVPIVILGRIVDPDGAPRAGAVVSSGAGGRALTDARGDYRLEVEVPLDASSVQVTAVAGSAAGSMVASGQIAIAASRTTLAGILMLQQGDCCQPNWVSTFGEQPGVDEYGISVLTVFDDGSGPALYAGGLFNAAGDVVGGHVAKWEGSGWSSLGGGPAIGSGRVVFALTVFDDGSGPALYAGGDFSNPGGKKFVAKWNGSSWSALGSGMNNTVFALTVFDDGNGPRLYAGGGFTTAGGVAANHIAKWDGSSWSALGGMNERVTALTVFDDGSGPALYASGLFTAASGVAANRIAKWDGTTWSALGSGLNRIATTMAVFDDGSGPALYAGGDFTIAGGAAANHIAKWDGTSWSALGSGMNGSGVGALTVFDDGGGPGLYAGGGFTTAGGVAANNIARWDGSSWSALGSGTLGSGTGSAGVGALAVYDAGGGAALYVGGAFGIAGGVAVNRIAAWDGSSWSALSTGMNAPVRALAVHDDGSGPALFAGGDFTTAGGMPANHIAKWAGSSWSALGSGMIGSVSALTVFDDGTGPALYAGGGDIAKWNGSSWSALGTGGASALMVFDDGSGPALYAGGYFTSVGGVAANHIAKWDGSSWSALGSGVSGPAVPFVDALAVYDDGRGPALYAGGSFWTASGVAANRIAKWDGSSWSALGTGMNNTVYALTVYDDGRGPALYAGGYFTSAGGVAAKDIAKWDGSSWSAFGTGMNNTVFALTVLEDGNGPALFAGGDFTLAGVVAVNRIARWDGSTWSALGSGMNGSVNALTAFDDGSGPAFFAGGEFPGALDSQDSFLAKMQCVDTTIPTISCPQDVLVVDGMTGPPGEIVTFYVQASDGCGTPSVVCAPPSGSFFPRGTTTVHCTATDAAGNQATCSFPVIVSLPRRIANGHTTSRPIPRVARAKIQMATWSRNSVTWKFSASFAWSPASLVEPEGIAVAANAAF